MRLLPSSARNATAVAAFATALALCLCGCASHAVKAVTSTSSGKVFAVTADKTSFYRYGPQQGNGADEELPRDTLVTLIRPSFGYSKVQLVKSSQEGYVASEDIRPAPPTLLAALNPPAPSPTSERENFDVRATDSNYVPPPETLPDPDLPPTSAEPAPTP
ncbi:MAG: hypothetical protein ACR2ID_04210 [Chthoniobacterales bacterium]